VPLGRHIHVRRLLTMGRTFGVGSHASAQRFRRSASLRNESCKRRRSTSRKCWASWLFSSSSASFARLWRSLRFLSSSLSPATLELVRPCLRLARADIASGVAGYNADGSRARRERGVTWRCVARTDAYRRAGEDRSLCSTSSRAHVR
jgi:hypothetical protein